MAMPDHLGKYQIRRVLGKGSMGIVYEGFDPLIERRVAIKIVRDDELDAGQLPDLLARLRREAQAAGRLNHPGIVAIYDYGEDSTQHGSHVAYIAMEMVDGGDLKTLFDSGQRFEPAQIARWMRDILGALQHAHDRGVTHRDIKPGNIMLLRDGSLKIADFGIARLESSELTRAGTVVGTPQYMSPEQLLGLAVDGRSDLFACGVILYQFLTGTKPFSGNYATVVQKVLNEEPAPPTRLNQALAPAWDAVVRKAMAKKAADRYQSAREFAQAVEWAAASEADEATVARPPGAPPARADGEEATVASAPGQLAAQTARPSRSWAMVGLVSALAAAALALAVYWLWPTTAPLPALVGRAPMPTPQPASRVEASPAAAPQPGPPSTIAAPSPPVAAPAAPIVAMPPPAASAATAAEPIPPAAAPAAPPRPAAKSTTATPAPASVAPPRVEPRRTEATAPAGAPSPEETAAAEWRARRAALEELRAPWTLPKSLAALLEPLRAEDRRRLAELEDHLRQLPPHVAVAVGHINGQLALTWRQRGSAQLAIDAVQKRCQELRATGCAVVQVDGEFRRGAFVAATAELGSRSVAEVRAAFAQALDRSLAASRTASVPAPVGATAQPPTPLPSTPAAPAPQATPATPAAPPAARPAAPASEWASALTALHSARGTLTLSKALALLLDVHASDELDTLARFESAMKRLPWKSALAMGERGGWPSYGWASRESKPQWAADSALERCGRASSGPCAVVMADGKFDEAAFLGFAARLGSRPQAAVRDGLVRALQRSLDKGI